MKTPYSRPASFLICLLVYMAALAVSVGFIVYFEGRINGLWLLLLADIIATVIVFGCSAGFKNSSLYDPYWSVAPPLLAVYWTINGRNDFTGYLVLATIVIWSVRLTANWARGWQGLAHEDWRYKMLREKNPGLYPLTNLTGIHLFPTFMVFLGMVPVYYLSSSENTISNIPLLISGLVITLAATAVELIADEQMRSFKKHAKAGEFINRGLWKYTRHPNYFGEISFWMGLWVIQMAIAPATWWTAIGFVAMLLMFLFVSIPMMEEKIRKSKAGYEVYAKRVSVLIPWPIRKLNQLP